MYAFRTRLGPADLCFTDRLGGVSAAPYDELNLSLAGPDAEADKVENLRLLMADFAPEDQLHDLYQVHGREVHVVEGNPGPVRPRADAIVCTRAGATLMVRAADCAPVLFLAQAEGIIGAAHAGRPGLVAGVVPETVSAMRALGAGHIEAWIGPHVCGRCYEVPSLMRAEVCAVVPEAHCATSWGTPSVDLGAGIHAQLVSHGVQVNAASRCTMESKDLFSYRRDGDRSGRQAGLIRLRSGQ